MAINKINKINNEGEQPNVQLFEAMKKAYERSSLMSCAINVSMFYYLFIYKEMKYNL